MKKVLTIITLLLITISVIGQTTITTGMSGLQFRNAVNGNFTTLYTHKNADTLINYPSEADYPQTVIIGRQYHVMVPSPSSKSIFIGKTTGIKTTTGVGNVAIGTDCFNNNTLGSENVAIGLYANSYNVSGDQNVGIGSTALEHNVSGSNNIGIGYRAVNTVSTTDMNVGIGYGALRYTIGTGNTAFGSAALYTTTGSLNVALGNYAGYYETGSNKLYIDNAARASEADARVKALIYGVFDAAPVNQKVTINGLLKLTPLADPPVGAVEGDIYADTDHHLYYHNGTTWVQLDN